MSQSPQEGIGSKIFRIAIVIASLTAGFGLGAWVDPLGDPKPRVPEPRPLDLGRPGRYVALGDSYSAGEGLPPYETGTEDTEKGGDRCHRSDDYAYPLLLTFVHETEPQFRACSGAIVDNVFGVIQEHGGEENRQGLQVADGIGGDDVTLVTISMGGNDLGFAEVLKFCFRKPTCTTLPYDGEETLERWINVHLDQIRSSLSSLYSRLEEGFPRARILALGYPALFPEAAPPVSKPQDVLCRAIFAGWKADERDAIREWGFRLNGIVELAATGAGAEYVDISSHFAGHEPCGAAGEWVRLTDQPTRVDTDALFHPLRDGQAMMARIVSCHVEVMEPGTTVPTLNQRYAMTGCVARETRFVAEPPPIEQEASAA